MRSALVRSDGLSRLSRGRWSLGAACPAGLGGRLGPGGGVAVQVGDPLVRDRLHDVGVDDGHCGLLSARLTGGSIRRASHQPVTTAHHSLTMGFRACQTGFPAPGPAR